MASIFNPTNDFGVLKDLFQLENDLHPVGTSGAFEGTPVESRVVDGCHEVSGDSPESCSSDEEISSRRRRRAQQLTSQRSNIRDLGQVESPAAHHGTPKAATQKPSTQTLHKVIRVKKDEDERKEVANPSAAAPPAINSQVDSLLQRMFGGIDNLRYVRKSQLSQTPQPPPTTATTTGRKRRRYEEVQSESLRTWKLFPIKMMRWSVEVTSNPPEVNSNCH